MKKVIGFLKWPAAYPVIALGIIYAIRAIWLINTPIESSVAGLILFIVYLVVTVLLKFSINKWGFSLALFIALLLLGGLISPVLLINLFLFAMDVTGIYNKIFIFVFIGGSILLVAYLTKTAIQKTPDKHGIIQILLLICTLPIMGINVLYLAIFQSTIYDKVEFGNNNYYIVSSLDLDFHSRNIFYKCKRWGFNCKELYGSYSANGWEIIVDEENKEVRLLEYANRLKYVDGAIPHSYNLEGESTLNDITYGLHYYEEGGIRNFVLNKCLSDAADSCTIIPLNISSPQSDEEREGIVANPSTNELYILFDKKIWHVYGNESLNYELLNSLETDQGTYSNANQYYIYSFERNSEYSYFVYGCESYFRSTA